MNTKKTNQVLIDLDNVTLRFGEMEPVVIPRSAIGTRLRLIDWVYRLTGWPGMKVQYLREFIAAIYRHHGWALPLPQEDTFLIDQEVDQSEREIPRSIFAPA
ncbi:MAG: hypothetical protein DLM73_17365 [Chthoniobacterales bacterium]|nr:MAG: hypothetical protein DLM73_17365 [Chthoniobacterales bacterium]